jgi:hypothetical protein
VALPPPDRAHGRLPRAQVREAAEIARRTSERFRPATRSERRPRTSPFPTRSSPRSSGRGPTGTSPATRRSPTG